ncbi:MAG: hypothetical protein ACOCWR_07105, partial [Oceanidesulfovibrio sp.]
SLESTAVQSPKQKTMPEEARADADELDILGLEELISDIELPEDDSAQAETVGEFNMNDFIEDESELDFEDITEEPETAAADESEELIDLSPDDIVEAGKGPAVEARPAAKDESFAFGDDLVDLSDTFDESLGGLDGLEGVMDMEKAPEEAAEAEAPADEWDVELPAEELETGLDEPAAEEAAMGEELAFEEEPAPAPAMEEFDFETDAEEPQAAPQPPQVPAAEAAETAPVMDQEAVEQLVSTLESMEARINSLEAAAAEREGLVERIASLESDLAQVVQSAGSLDESVREALQKLDTSLGENGAVAAMVTQRLDSFRQILDAMEPAKDEELAARVEQLESLLEQARAEQDAAIKELASKAARLDEIDALAATVEQTPSVEDVQAAASQAAQSAVDERIQQALGENGAIASAIGQPLEHSLANLRAELTEQMEAVRKTAEDAAAAQPNEQARAEAVRKSVREELDKELAEGGNAAKALRDTVDKAVVGLRAELTEQMEAVRKTAEDAAAAQPNEQARAEAVRKSVREELDKELAEGGAVASRIEERIGAVEESARLDNMALESRLSQTINQFGDPESVPEPLINAISTGIVEAMDEGGPFHSRLEERIAEISKERQDDLTSLADRIDEVLQTFRDEGVSREEVESMVAKRFAALEESLPSAGLNPEDVGAIADERTRPAVEEIRAELAKERERIEGLVKSSIKDMGDSIPSAQEMRSAASEALDQAVPGLRSSLMEEFEARLDKQPMSNATREAIADAVETRMRDSLSENSDIYENLVGNLTEQLERVIREGVEKLERKTVSHEDWNVMAARLRQELSTKIESEAAKSAARVIREEISNLLSED